VAPIDLVVGAPLVARLIVGASPIGRAVQGAAIAAYLGSALRDWRERRAVERVDFLREFGADIKHLKRVPRAARLADVRRLAERLNDEFTPARIPRRDVAIEVDRHLTRYIAGLTGQEVETSVAVRSFTIARLAWPSALGVCDILSGDVAIFRDTGLFEPHIIAHEFTHRKGYWKELHAQVLAYLSLVQSGEPVLRQASLAERAYRNLRVLSRGDIGQYVELVRRFAFRPELAEALMRHRMSGGPATGAGMMDTAMRRAYDARMRLTGQNGLSDYDVGFTGFLHTFETSATARQRPTAI
jgi:hypothetical protein